MDFILIQTLNGLASASSLFLVASGLSIIFGVTRIVNFAHGSLYMIGAYLCWQAATAMGAASIPGFAVAVIIAAIGAGVVGAALEMTLLRRIYKAPELFQLLATFGVVLIVQDAALWIWGAEDKGWPRPPEFRSFVTILGSRFPVYELFLIAVGPVVLAGLWLLFNRTRWGVLVRAATQDREMVGALGVDQRLLFTGVFILGSCLAGLGGALQVPRGSVTLHMDLDVITEVFVVVVVGGLGSVTGAYLAAVLIGVVHAFGILVFPKITLVLVFLVMAVVLVARPYGLMGRRPSGQSHAPGPPEPLLTPDGGGFRIAAAACVAALAAAPFLVGDAGLIILTELLILALFAASLHLMMGPGGMASFGHAAFFGLGAYGAAKAATALGAPMLAGLALGPLTAGLAGLVFGLFCVRLSGVYLAMLTLAFAQIVWATAFQWVELTGGDNGLLGVWPAPWAAGKPAYFWLTLTVAGAGVLAMRRLIFSPFGYALRAARDSRLRSEAIGVDVFRVQWMAFVVAAIFAGLAGGLFAFFKGSVFPTYMAIPKSVDALLMVLLGGVGTVTGPIVGAIAFVGLEEQLQKATAYWRLWLGLAIVCLVVAFPKGLVGAARDLAERRSAPAPSIPEPAR